jgi:hypothetical protein
MQQNQNNSPSLNKMTQTFQLFINTNNKAIHTDIQMAELQVQNDVQDSNLHYRHDGKQC